MKKGLKQFAFIIFSLVVALTMVGCKRKTTKTEPQKTNPPQSSTTTTKKGGESQTQTQPTQKVLKQLNLKSEPTKTSIFMDELDTEDLLQGAVFEAQYSDGSKKTLNLSELSVTMPEDGVTLGDNEITVSYEEAGVKKSFVLSIFLKLKGKEDVEEYLVFAFDQKGDETLCPVPSLPEGTKLYDMLGEEIVPVDGNIAYSGAGELFLKAVTGDSETYVLVKVGHLIETEEDFAKINEDLDGYYILHNDIYFEKNNQDSMIGKIAMVTTGEGDAAVTAPDFSDATNKAFNGTLDGNGYSLVGFKYVKPDKYLVGEEEKDLHWYDKEAYGYGIFAYVGEEGTIMNLSLKHCEIKGGQSTSLLVGVNKGYIHNVVIEDSNMLYSNYGRGAAISAFNYGTIQNIVCRLTKFDARDNKEINMTLSLAENVAEEVANGFIDRLDHSEDLPNEFMFVEGFGMALVNPHFVAIANEARSELHLGERFEVKVVTAEGVEPHFLVTVDGAPKTGVTVEKDATDGKYYLVFTPGELEADNEVMIMVASNAVNVSTYENIEVIDALFVNVLAANLVSVELKYPINVIEGLDIDITGAKLVFTYSDSTTKELDVLHQVGFDKTKGVGAQTIKLFYGEAQNLFVECEVNIVAKEATGIEIRKTEAAKASYQKDETLSLDGYTVVVKYNNNTESESVALTAQMIDQTSYNMLEAGEYNVKVTYEGFDATFKIVVTEVSLTDINITGNLLKDTYKYGDTLTAADFASVTVEATYSDNSVTPLSFTDYSISYDFNKVGSADVRITYNGISKNAFTVTVEDYEKSLSVEFNELGENDKFIYDIANKTDNFKDFFKSVKVIMASGALNELTGSDLDLVKPVGLKSGACQLGFKLVDSVAHETIVETENKVDVEVWYQVTLGEQWSYIQEHLDGYYVLASDITLTGSNNQIGVVPLVSKTTIDGEGNGNAETGQVGRAFTGKFDGKGHKIINFKVESKTYGDIESYYLGIFGWIGANAVVENFVVDGAVISGWQDLTFLAVRVDGTLQHVTILANSVIKHWTEAEGWAPVYAVYGQSCGGSLIRDIVCYARTGLRGSTPITVEQRLVSKDWGTVSDIYIGAPFPVEIKSIDTNNIQVPQDETLDLSTVFITVKLSDGTEIQTHPTSIEGELDTSTLGEKEVNFKYEANGHYALIVGAVTVTEHIDKMVAQLKEGKTGVVIPYNNGWDLANVTNWSDIITIKINDETTTDMTGISVIADKLSGTDVAVYFNKEGHTSSKVIMTVDLEIKDHDSFMAINNIPHGRFVLTQDVVLNPTTNPQYITAEFVGYLDGNFHTLNVNIASEGANGSIFKGTSSAHFYGVVKNLIVTGGVSFGGFGGGIVMNNEGSILNCVVKLTVASSGSTGDVGGIALDNAGTISNCLFIGHVVGNANVAGIVRKTKANGITQNCVFVNDEETPIHNNEPEGTETNLTKINPVINITENTFGLSDEIYAILLSNTYKTNATATDFVIAQGNYDLSDLFAEIAKIEMNLEFNNGRQVVVHPSTLSNYSTNTIQDITTDAKYTDGNGFIIAVPCHKKVYKGFDVINNCTSTITVSYNDEKQGWSLEDIDWLNLVTFKSIDAEGHETVLDSMDGITIVSDTGEKSGENLKIWFYKGSMKASVTVSIVFEIANENQFLKINNNLSDSFVLVNDIIFSSGINTPYITGEFTGVLDGQDHKLFVRLVDSSTGKTAIFAPQSEGNNAVIKNLVVEGTISSNNQIIAGITPTNYGTIENCFVHIGIYASTGAKAATITYYNYGVVNNCVVEIAKINGAPTKGYIVGKTCGTGSTTNCVAVTVDTDAQATAEDKDSTATESTLNVVSILCDTFNKPYGLSYEMHSLLNGITIDPIYVNPKYKDTDNTVEGTYLVVGESVSASDIYIKLTNNEGTAISEDRIVVTGVTVDTSSAGEKTITIKYEVDGMELTFTHEVTVIAE